MTDTKPRTPRKGNTSREEVKEVAPPQRVKVLGIDPSLTATALIGLDAAGQVVLSRTIGTTKAAHPIRPARIDAMRAALLEGLACQPELVVLEGYSFASKNGQAFLGEWGGLLRWSIWGEMLPYLEVPPTSLKQYVAGKGNAPKEVMLREVYRRWGFSVDDDNAADAFGLAQLGLEYLQPVRTEKFEKLASKFEIIGGPKTEKPAG